MKEYIEREAIRNELYDMDAITMMGVAAINNFPAADVKEVVHGKWIVEQDSMGWNTHVCSECGCTKRTDTHVSLGWKFCPMCGADMDGNMYKVYLKGDESK